jgi:hypothetical protein
MMRTLCTRLQPLTEQLHAAGVQTIVEEMLEANRMFEAVEEEHREIIAAQKLDDTPASMTALRRQIDPIYRSIVAVIDAYSGIPSVRDEYRELVAEVNVLAARYDALLAARRRERTVSSENQQDCDCE